MLSVLVTHVSSNSFMSDCLVLQHGPCVFFDLHTVQHFAWGGICRAERGTGWGQALHMPSHTVSPTARRVPRVLTVLLRLHVYHSYREGRQLIHKICAFQGLKVTNGAVFKRSTVNLISTTSAGHEWRTICMEFSKRICQSLFYLLYYVFKLAFLTWEMYKKIISYY